MGGRATSFFAFSTVGFCLKAEWHEGIRDYIDREGLKSNFISINTNQLLLLAKLSDNELVDNFKRLQRYFCITQKRIQLYQITDVKFK